MLSDGNEYPVRRFAPVREPFAFRAEPDIDTWRVFKRSPWQFLFVTALTVLRVLLVIPIVLMINSAYHIDVMFAFALAVVATNLDWMDGFFARRWQVVSKFGRFADPISDKIFFLTALIALYKHIQWQLVVWIVAVEILLVVHRVYVLARARGADVSANNAGKWKAIFQGIVICSLILGQYLEPYSASMSFVLVDGLGNILLIASFGLSCLSLAVHMHKHGIIRLH